MNSAEGLIQKLMNYYQVFTITELADKMGVSQPSISGWKRNNYIKAIANKCRELGIYNEIFEDNHNGKLEDIKTEDNIIINSVLLEKAKNEASKFGLDINSYLEHLIIQDLKK